MYMIGLAFENLLPLVAALPGLLIAVTLGADGTALGSDFVRIAAFAPFIAASFILAEMAVVAAAVRAASRLIKPGLHPDHGATGWALWFTESLLAGARATLFPLYSSVYTRGWLRLLGIRVGKRSEVSTVAGVNRLSSFGSRSFATDDVVFAGARAWRGWVQVTPIEVGDGSFLGNGAILDTATQVGTGSLVGVMTTPPREVPDGTSWFGCPPLELPRRAEQTDPSRTTDPPRRLVLARGAIELVRILLPATFSLSLGLLLVRAIEGMGRIGGVPAMAASIPVLLLAAGICASLFTIALKWLLMGRYRPGAHPLWSLFVWRDEIVNTAQEQIARTWLIDIALGTALMSVYLRLMGAKVGRDVWCETVTITEFDLVELGDGCVLNRFCVVETHLFHDRLMRIGPARVGAGATLGPSSAMLPDSALGDGCSAGGRSVVMRGEQLPPGTRWHGSPVVVR
jgi:non-ribosomal peptide synthetase-like protein